MPTESDAKKLGLTKKESELLELLESNPGRCFSRDYLLRRIWGYADQTRTRTVDVHVSRLRKKLEGRPDVAIHTVVRKGYVFEQVGKNLSSLSASVDADNRRAAAVAG